MTVPSGLAIASDKVKGRNTTSGTAHVSNLK